MRFHTVALLTGATAAAAGNTATLLLPGFEGHDLQAGVIGSNGDATTYLVNCPQTVAAAACGIPGNGMTAIAAPTSMQLINVDSNSNTASVSCNVAGQTWASCSAHQGTMDVQSTLGPKDLNWMPVTVTGPLSTSTPTPTPTPTPTSTVTPTSTATPTSTVTPSSTWTPTSTPKSSTSSMVSSTRLVISSTPVIPPSTVTGTPLPTQSAVSTTPASLNAASSLSGNVWAMGGAALALAYALV